MRCLGILAGVGTVLVLLAGCQHSSTGPDDWTGIVPPEVLAKASLEYYWKCSLPLDADEQVRRIWQLDENLYVLTSSNRLLAVDAVQGRYKWFYEVAGPGQIVFAPCHSDNVVLPEASGIAALLQPPDVTRIKPFEGVIINTLSHVLVFERDTGTLRRKLELGFAANSPGSTDGVHFYVGSVNGRYYAVRLSEGLNEWTRSTGDMISARPVVFRRRLYVASQDGSLYCVDSQQGKRRDWRQRTDGPITADFAVDIRGCFVGSQDYKVYACELLTGTQLWAAFRTQGVLRQPVQPGVRSVFAYAEGDRFYAIDLASGRKRWELPDGRVVVAAVEPHVFVLDADRQLLMVHESLGQVELSLPMTGLDLFVPNAGKPFIFAGTFDGKLVCIRPISPAKLTDAVLRD